MKTLDRGQATLVELLQLAGIMKTRYQKGDFEPILSISRHILNSQEVPNPKELDFRMFIYECLKLASPIPVHLLNNLICFTRPRALAEWKHGAGEILWRFLL